MDVTNAVKNELIQTTLTRGWTIVKQVAEDLVREAEVAAFRSKANPEERLSLLDSARAAREFHDKFFSTIENLKSLDTEDSRTSFVPVTLD